MSDKNPAKTTILGLSKHTLVTFVLAAVGMIAAALTLFFHPQPLFGWSARVGNLTIYSDQPFAPADGEKMLEQVQLKLSTSPLYSTKNHYDIFICNTEWRRTLFFIAAPQAGGVVYYPLSTNVYLVGGDLAQNRLISRSGLPDVLGRRLDHFIAHEIAHDLTGEAVGWLPYHSLPVWIREGYAEYIGSQGVFNYNEAEKAFKENDSIMNTPPNVPYLKYNFLVAYLLDQKNWSPLELFETRLTQNEVEEMLKK